MGIRACNQAALGWPALSRVTWKARPSLSPHAGRGFRESRTLQESGPSLRTDSPVPASGSVLLAGHRVCAARRKGQRTVREKGVTGRAAQVSLALSFFFNIDNTQPWLPPQRGVLKIMHPIQESSHGLLTSHRKE